MKNILYAAILLLHFSLAAQNSYIQRDKATADIDSMNKTIRDVHYNPFLFISEKAYQEKTDSIKATIADSIEIKDLLRKLYILTASFKDAHTAPGLVQPVLRPLLSQKLFAPFNFISDEKEHIYVANNNIGPFNATDQILSINDVDLTRLAKEITRYSGGDANYAKEIGDKFLGYYLFLAGVRPPFQISYQHGREVKQTMIDSGVTFRNALAASIPAIAGKTYDFSIINNKIGYLDFISMGVSLDKFSRYADSVMRIMRNQQLPALVIDLRKNSGGNSFLADRLISYFSDKNYNLMGMRYWKISQQYKDYLVKNGNASNPYLKIENGTILPYGDCKPQPPRFKVDSVYNGHIYIITGPFTFSSANMFADGAKEYKLATVIGEPTGERTNDFGEVYTFTLPNSKIQMNATTSFDIGADCNKERVSTVQPDILIKTTTDQKQKGIDPVMEYILKKEGVK